MKRERLNGYGSSTSTEVAVRKPGRPLGSKTHRPKRRLSVTKAEVAKYARQYTLPAIRMLWKIANDRKASRSARVSAINSILDRALGRAAQVIQLEDDEGNALPGVTFNMRVIRPDDQSTIIDVPSNVVGDAS